MGLDPGPLAVGPLAVGLGFLGMENNVFIRDDINKYNTYGAEETAAACAQFQYQTHDGTSWVDADGNLIA